MANMRTVEPEELDILAHQAEYAKASGAVDNPDHAANLEILLNNLLQKRRNLAQDAIAYPIAFMGRAIDISRLQPIIEAVERAIADEKRRK
ncbi:MAG: hypothetical protein ACODTL_00200 [Brucella sp.]